jgi:hypothetical protein
MDGKLPTLIVVLVLTSLVLSLAILSRCANPLRQLDHKNQPVLRNPWDPRSQPGRKDHLDHKA